MTVAPSTHEHYWVCALTEDVCGCGERRSNPDVWETRLGRHVEYIDHLGTHRGEVVAFTGGEVAVRMWSSKLGRPMKNLTYLPPEILTMVDDA